MLRAFAVACVALAIVSTGCDSKPTYESLRKDGIATMKEMIEVLKGVKDEASAKAAKPKLDALGKKMETLEAESNKVEKPSAEEQKKLDEKFQEDMFKLVGELATEIDRIGSDPKLVAVLGPIPGAR